MSNNIFIATNLRTAGMAGKIYTGNPEPELSWKMSHIPGAMQKAYRIQASSSPDVSVNPDIWDSGWIESEQSVGIKWGGAPLKSRQHVFWQVTLQDQSGNFSTPSQIAEFETVLLCNSDWGAHWIYNDRYNSSCSSPCPYFRHEFQLNKAVKRAVLYVSARGLFEVRLNGKRIGEDHFVPGWTDFNKQIQYLSYDVTDFIFKGKNAAGAILGDGWYCGYLSGRNRNTYGNYPEFLFQLEITFEDNSIKKVVSDENWLCSTGPILASDIYDGEQYDARLEMPGWDRTGFDDSCWHPATLGESAVQSPLLVQKCSLPVRRIMTLKPVCILNPQKDIYIWDFGQNITGRIKVRLKGDAGRLYSFYFGEMLNPDGTLYNLNYRSAKSTDYYTCQGSGEYEEWEPLFTFHGFRYLQINGFQYSGVELKEIEVEAVVLHSELETTGYFECGNAKVNQLYSNICWGQRDNFLEIPTDCPQRDERLGWTGDADVFIGAAVFNMNVETFFRKWLRDLRESQRQDGAVASVVPNLFEWGFGAAVWADAAVRCPWMIYRHYGNSAVLTECYESMKKWVDYQKNSSVGLIRPKTSYGDWLALSDVKTPSELIGTAMFAETAKLLGKTAEVLNYKEDALYYNDLAEQVRKAFRQEFTDSHGLLKIKTQTACVLALQFDLLTPEQQKQNAELLVELIRNNGTRLSTGFVGTAWLNQALSRSGHTETAYDLLLQEEYPSWLFSVNQGATTVWERWNSYTVKDGFGDVNMNSFNHYAYGAVAEWMAAAVGGIQFVDEFPGGKKLRFAAEPDRRLGYAKCSLETPYGKAESCWQFEEDKWIWNIKAPCNTYVEVIPPALVANTIILNGKPIDNEKQLLENGSFEIVMFLK